MLLRKRKSSLGFPCRQSNNVAFRRDENAVTESVVVRPLRTQATDLEACPLQSETDKFYYPFTATRNGRLKSTYELIELVRKPRQRMILWSDVSPSLLSSFDIDAGLSRRFRVCW